MQRGFYLLSLSVSYSRGGERESTHTGSREYRGIIGGARPPFVRRAHTPFPAARRSIFTALVSRARFKVTCHSCFLASPRKSLLVKDACECRRNRAAFSRAHPPEIATIRTLFPLCRCGRDPRQL